MASDKTLSAKRLANSSEPIASFLSFGLPGSKVINDWIVLKNWARREQKMQWRLYTSSLRLLISHKLSLTSCKTVLLLHIEHIATPTLAILTIISFPLPLEYTKEPFWYEGRESTGEQSHQWLHKVSHSNLTPSYLTNVWKSSSNASVPKATITVGVPALLHTSCCWCNFKPWYFN